MKKQFVAVIFLGAILVTNACAGRLTPTAQPPSSASPTKAAEIQPTMTMASESSAYGDYGAPAEVANPGAGSAPAEGSPNQAFFQDNLATGDMLVVNISGIKPAPTGQVYQGWIRNEDGSLINTGVLEVKGDGIRLEWTAPDGRNLIATTTGFVINLDNAPGSSELSGKIVYAGEMSTEQIAAARNLFVVNTSDPATPRNKAFALALVQQTGLASAHIDNALNAEAIGAFNERALHLEHVINIIEGSKGERFKDYNGDGNAENPGDGFGVIAYAAQLAKQLNQENITSKTQEALVALVDIEQKIIAILESQPGAISLAELRKQFDEIDKNQITELYRLSEQAVAFNILPISSP